MPRSSFAKIKREMAHLESLEVTAALAQEKIQLAELLEQESGLGFDQAQDLIEMMCEELLPGHRGVDKLFVFRRRIRDRLMDNIRQRQEIENHQAWVEHEDSCTCPPSVVYGLDIPGLGCEVCPHCAEKLDKQDIPF